MKSSRLWRKTSSGTRPVVGRRVGAVVVGPGRRKGPSSSFWDCLAQ